MQIGFPLGNVMNWKALRSRPKKKLHSKIHGESFDNEKNMVCIKRIAVFLDFYTGNNCLY